MTTATIIGGALDRASNPTVVVHTPTTPRPAPPPRTTAPTFYPLMSTRRAANAVVRLEVGCGSDPDALKVALRRLKRATEDSGVMRAVARHTEFVPRTKRRRDKSRRARLRVVKVARMRERHAAYLDEHPRARGWK